jgi:hypothetical protein
VRARDSGLVLTMSGKLVSGTSGGGDNKVNIESLDHAEGWGLPESLSDETNLGRDQRSCDDDVGENENVEDCVCWKLETPAWC